MHWCSMTQHDVRLYLGQMLDAAREAQSYVNGVDLVGFADDQMRQRAITYVIQVIGEAARRVSLDERARIPEIPWSKVVGMRNKLVHDYLYVDFEEVWRTATNDLPDLIDVLERVLYNPSSDEPEQSS